MDELTLEQMLIIQAAVIPNLDPDNDVVWFDNSLGSPMYHNGTFVGYGLIFALTMVGQPHDGGI